MSLNEVGISESLYLDRARGCMAGLAIGDALGRPVEGMSNAEIREKYGSINDFLLVSPGGSDDTEYAILTALAILEYGLTITREQFADYWRAKVVSQSAPFAGAGFSEMSAINNLRRGLQPPFSGQHAHAWSDGLAMRVAPIAIASVGDYELARCITKADGEVSHSGEGIWSGQAITAAIVAALGGEDAVHIFDRALDSVPKDSWTYRNLLIAKEILDLPGLSLQEQVDQLLTRLAVTEYFYADLAPEAVSLALAAVLYGDGDFAKTLLFAVNLGRDADTIAAMSGAIAGAQNGYSGIPDNWKTAIVTVKGTCLEFAAGINPMELADDLVALRLAAK